VTDLFSSREGKRASAERYQVPQSVERALPLPFYLKKINAQRGLTQHSLLSNIQIKLRGP
jgi:hypothetical protein